MAKATRAFWMIFAALMVVGILVLVIFALLVKGPPQP
jgi:hypothetical protein